MSKRTSPRSPRVGVARFNLEISPEDLEALKRLAEKKSKAAGKTVTMSALVRPMIKKILDRG